MKKQFVSLDRHAAHVGDYDEPDRYRELLAITTKEALIPRGSGLSYVAASFGEGVRSIGMSRFNRILNFNATEQWIEVEAGITLGSVYRFCSMHGFTLPVQPGYPQITIGGCIAGNVHGKNQYSEGLFGEHVLGLQLFHPDHGLLELSPATNGELFDLTIGGLGLTGIIVKARLSLVPLGSSSVLVNHLEVQGVDEAIDRIVALRDECEMIYAWLDFAKSDSQGRGFVVTGAGIPGDGSKPEASCHAEPRLNPSGNRFRPSIFNALSLPLINKLYHHLNLKNASNKTPLFDFLFPALGKEFYFDWFGKLGFIEMQVLIPSEVMREYAREAAGLFRKHAVPIALTTIKAFYGQSRLLHYNGSGFSFTIDVCNTTEALRLLSDLDELNCGAGGITAIMKDSRLSLAIVKRQYPQYEIFRQRLRAFDPDRRFRSALSSRLGL